MTETHTPSTNGPAPLVTPDGSRLITRRPGRETFPASWLRHRVTVTYGDGQDLACTLLEYCSVGLIVAANGSKSLISWEALKLVELVED